MDAQVPVNQDNLGIPPKSQPEARQSYLETVLSTPLQPLHAKISTYGNYAHYPSRNSQSDILSAALSTNNGTDESLTPPVKDERSRELSRATLPSFHDFPSGAFCIDCNNCGASIPDEHYHCSICDGGDFDLCQGCVDREITCDGEGHWLIKRSIRNGMVVSSVTETLPPKVAKSEEPHLESSKHSAPVTQAHCEAATGLTCNCCVRGEWSLNAIPLLPQAKLIDLPDFPDDNFLSCIDCPDFDLCLPCFSRGKHGHHPAHQFQPFDEGSAKTTSSHVLALCGAGRGVKHAAICDGCDKVGKCPPLNSTLLTRLQSIVGIRHKCLNCPDWDFCSTCRLSASQIHPAHRFAPLYEPIPDNVTRAEVHCGIYCDGPLCAARRHKSYIRGDRYKCAVCNDTDFCANCEAIPTHDHNRTHPLIKFKTPVRHVSVTTLGENNNGEKMSQMGDSPRARNASTETVATSANAATQVQTVAEVKPTEVSTRDTTKPEPIATCQNNTPDLQAWFESDSTPDGSRFAPNRIVSQSWTLRNPGPQAWPAGCAVYYIGGDDMRNLDANHPSSVTAMTCATRSNILDNSVESGKTAAFTVLLKSPPREGRVISYWRLKTPDGVPFGHKLWVDITVTASLDEGAHVQPDSPSAVPRTPAATDEGIKSEESEGSSTMIFPKLEKESPVASTHDMSEVPAPTPAPAPSVSATTKTEEQELLEDVESLELEDEQTDDEFLTDEEYDILDASDEDFLTQAQKVVKA